MQKRHIPQPQAVSLMDITFESLFLLFCYCLIKYHCWLLPPVSVHCCSARNLLNRDIGEACRTQHRIIVWTNGLEYRSVARSHRDEHILGVRA